MKERQENVYVLDTCILINDPDILFKLGNNQIVIPTAVIKELDCMKRDPNPEEPRARAARKVTRTLDTLGSHQNIASGAKTSTGSTIRICNRHVRVDDLASNADNRIVGTALKLKEETEHNVILLTTDGNMRNVIRSYGIPAESYPFCSNNLNNRHKKPSAGTAPSWVFIAAMAAVIFFALFLDAR